MNFKRNCGIVLLLLLFSCQQLQDKNNQNASIPRSYSRIISMAPGITETLYALDLGSRVVGTTQFCHYPPEAQKTQKVGGYLNPNYEAIALLNPDLVILLPEHEQVKTYLDELDVEYLVVPNKTVNDILFSIESIGKKCGAEEKAAQIVGNLKAAIKTIQEKTKTTNRPKVMLCIGRLVDSGSLEEVYIAGKNTHFDELIEMAGGINAFTDEKLAYPMLSAEGVIYIDPDIIIELIAENNQNSRSRDEIVKAWHQIPHVKAVENEALYVLNSDYVFIPGPRFICLLKDFERIIHSRRDDD